jgi:virulence factor Mce-like protein
VIRKRMLINLVVFFAVSIALVLYGITSLIGNPLASPTDISSVFTDASGISPHFAVELNGVDVGTVTGVQLAPGGARVDMAINPGVSVPGNVTASIDVANDLGEQVVELTPKAAPAPPLRSGATVPSNGSIPVDIGNVVSEAVRLLKNIPAGDLNSVLGDLATALQGEGNNLRSIVTASTAFSKEFLAYQNQFKALLANAPPVMDAVSAVGPQLSQALANTEVLMAVLAQDRAELDPLFRSSTSATQLLDQLVVNQGPDLACIFHDAADLMKNLSAPPNLSNLSQSLALNHLFFGAINSAIVPGATKALTTSVPAQSNQLIARTRLLLPPQQPMASAYSSPVGLPAIYPGAGCVTELGPGVGPATQPGFQPAGQDAHPGQLQPAPPAASEVPGTGGTQLPPNQQAADAASGPWPLVPVALFAVTMLLLGWTRRSPRRRAALLGRLARKGGRRRPFSL